MKKLATLILLTVILLLSILTTACVDNGGNNSSGAGITVESTPTPHGFDATMSAANATATYGADQFYLQLTAIANEGQ